MELVIGVLWTIVLFLLLYWSGQHSLSIWRSGPSTYFPHISHFCAWGYPAISLWILSAKIVEKDNTVTAGAILIFLFGLWQMSRAIRLLIGYINKKDVVLRH